MKTMPVMSGGFQIETEISICRGPPLAGGRRLSPPRPPEGLRALSTFSDGMLRARGHREPVPRLPPHGLLRMARPGARRGGAVLRAAGGGSTSAPATWRSSLGGARRGARSWRRSPDGWLILDTVAKSHRRQWEMSVYRVMEADAER